MTVISVLIRLGLLGVLTFFMVTLWTVEGQTVMTVITMAGSWHVQARTGLLLFTSVTVMGAMLILIGTVMRTVLGMRAVRRAWRDRRRIRNLMALVRGFALLAADLPLAARQSVSRIKPSGPEADTRHFLIAASMPDPGGQQTSDDESATSQTLQQALAEPSFRPLALKSLSKLDHIRSSADDYAVLLKALKQDAGDAPWSRQERYQHALRTKNWDMAVSMVVGDGDKACQTRAGLLTENARQALDSKEALSLASQACQHVPNWSPAVVVMMTALINQGHSRRAEQLLHKTWLQTPHPSLIPSFLVLTVDIAPDQMLDRVQGMIASDPLSYAARLLWVECLLRTDRIDDLKQGLETLTTEYPTQTVFRLWARAFDHGIEMPYDQVLTLTQTITHTGVWGCRHCGYTADEWFFICPSCGQDATCQWRDAISTCSKSDPL